MNHLVIGTVPDPAAWFVLAWLSLVIELVTISELAAATLPHGVDSELFAHFK